jgi:hypothetical protein
MDYFLHNINQMIFAMQANSILFEVWTSFKSTEVSFGFRGLMEVHYAVLELLDGWKEGRTDDATLIGALRTSLKLTSILENVCEKMNNKEV